MTGYEQWGVGGSSPSLPGFVLTTRRAGGGGREEMRGKVERIREELLGGECRWKGEGQEFRRDETGRSGIEKRGGGEGVGGRGGGGGEGVGVRG